MYWIGNLLPLSSNIRAHLPNISVAHFDPEAKTFPPVNAFSPPSHITQEKESSPVKMPFFCPCHIPWWRTLVGTTSLATIWGKISAASKLYKILPWIIKEGFWLFVPVKLNLYFQENVMFLGEKKLLDHIYMRQQRFSVNFYIFD